MRKLLLATAASVSTLLAAGTANAQSLKPVAPGTIQIHLNGYLQFSIGNIGGNGMSGGSTAATSTVPAFKVSPVATTGDVRLYPGFDGMTINSVAYGVQVELRTALTNANGSGVNNNASSTNGTGGLYVRRAYGYIGTSTYGYVRFGQGDGAFELLQRGVIETFGDGNQWTGEGTVVTMLPGGAPTQFIYADQGALYTTNKIVYVSPALQENELGGKFSAVVSYEPTSNGLKEGDATVSSNLGQTTSIAGGSNKLRKNTFDGMVDYSVKIDSFASKISTGYLTAQPNGNLTGAQGFAPMGVWQVGAQTTYTGLFTGDDTITVGGNIKGGSVTDKYAFKVKGGRNALAYILGTSYTNGPYVLGASFFDSQESNGTVSVKGSNVTQGHTLSEYGVAVGANYIVAKPLSLFVQYMYGNVHGAKPTSSVATGPGNFPHGNGHAQVIALGATFKW
jgi:hypothetical protein